VRKFNLWWCSVFYYSETKLNGRSFCCSVHEMMEKNGCCKFENRFVENQSTLGFSVSGRASNVVAFYQLELLFLYKRVHRREAASYSSRKRWCPRWWMRIEFDKLLPDKLKKSYKNCVAWQKDCMLPFFLCPLPIHINTNTQIKLMMLTWRRRRLEKGLGWMKSKNWVLTFWWMENMWHEVRRLFE